MKKVILKFSALFLSLMLVLTVIPPLSFNAEETVSVKAESINSEHNFGRTGDLGIKEECSEDVYTIDSQSDYLNLVSTETSSKKDLAMTGSVSLPSSVDNSESPYFPVIGDQGGLGACVVFATVYYQFTYTMNKSRGVHTTEDNIFSVKWAYNMVNSGRDGGSAAFKNYQLLQQHGCPTAKTLPYDGVDYKGWSTDEKVWREAMRYRIKDYQEFTDIGGEGKEITSNDDTDLLAIKTALSNGEVLKFSSYIYSWKSDKLKTNPNAPENDKYKDEEYIRVVDGHDGGHGMVIVGYNDNLWCDINGNNVVDDGEMGALKIANSWGKGYGNDGFMWISYDALNEVSCVQDAKIEDVRVAAISEIYRIDVCEANEGDDMYIKFTLNTADRTQFKVTFTADKNGSQYSKNFLSTVVYSNEDNKCAFDGTNTACDATFAYPINSLIPEIKPEDFEDCNFNITIADTKQDSVPLYVKDVTLVNEYTNKEYKVNANYPISLNGSEFSANIKEGINSNTVIYYIGYDNPDLYYKTVDNSFVKVKMEENSERHGYLYKYIIRDTYDDVKLYFGDENGKIDNNSGDYYTAKKGVNFFYTKNQREKLTLKDFGFLNGIPDVNKRLLFDIKVSGGYETYKYKYIIENLDTGVTREYDYDHNYDISPFIVINEGTHRITIVVMDYAKETDSLTKEFEIVNHPFEITSITLDKSTPLVSKNVMFTSTTSFEGIASYGGYSAKSRFSIKDSSGKVWCDEIVKYSTYSTAIKNTTTVYNFTPHKSGVYTLTVSSDDCNKEHAEKTITFTVCDMIYGDADANGVVNTFDATAIQRYLARLAQEDSIDKELADGDVTGAVDIMDTTIIQRYLALKDNCGEVGNIIEYIPPTEPPTEPTTPAPTIAPTEASVKNTVTFTNSLNWGGTIYCYYWSDSNTAMTSWPGVAMTNASTNDFSETLYTFDVPGDATYIIFSNGSSQTVDISYGGGEVRYYALNTKTGNGYNVETW